MLIHGFYDRLHRGRRLPQVRECVRESPLCLHHLRILLPLQALDCISLYDKSMFKKLYSPMEQAKAKPTTPAPTMTASASWDCCSWRGDKNSALLIAEVVKLLSWKRSEDRGLRCSCLGMGFDDLRREGEEEEAFRVDWSRIGNRLELEEMVAIRPDTKLLDLAIEHDEDLIVLEAFNLRKRDMNFWDVERLSLSCRSTSVPASLHPNTSLIYSERMKWFPSFQLPSSIPIQIKMVEQLHRIE